TSITRFEFVEGQRLAPSGAVGDAIQPLCAVDGVLLELTRRLDEWTMLKDEVGGPDEVYELIGPRPDPLEAARNGDHASERVIPLIDGCRSTLALVDESDCDRFAVAKTL